MDAYWYNLGLDRPNRHRMVKKSESLQQIGVSTSVVNLLSLADLLQHNFFPAFIVIGHISRVKNSHKEDTNKEEYLE